MSAAQLLSWWTGSALQVSIAVSAFWLALIVAICALAGANRRGRDMRPNDVDDILRASAPAPLNCVTLEHARQHVRVRGIS